MFNKKAMDVGSFITFTALANRTVMEKHFPLYHYAPKMVATLQPGDILMNPQVHETIPKKLISLLIFAVLLAYDRKY